MPSVSWLYETIRRIVLCLRQSLSSSLKCFGEKFIWQLQTISSFQYKTLDLIQLVRFKIFGNISQRD